MATPAVQEFAVDELSWEVVSEIIEDGSVEALARLQRSKEGLAFYEDALLKIKQEFASTADYLFCSVFGADATIGPDGRKAAVKTEALLGNPSSSQQQAPIVVWRLNDFPYHFSKGIAHHLMWSSQPLPVEEIRARIAERFPASAGWEALHFVNPVALQSVRAIWHCHVLVRRRAEA